MIVEVDGNIIEDACWLRKDYSTHINCRVLGSWSIKPSELAASGTISASLSSKEINHALRSTGHYGVKRTLYFVRRIDTSVSREEVRYVVEKCIACQSIYPSPIEILTDIDTVFRNTLFSQFMNKWNVKLRFRCAYVLSRNGIVERCNQT